MTLQESHGGVSRKEIAHARGQTDRHTDNHAAKTCLHHHVVSVFSIGDSVGKGVRAESVYGYKINVYAELSSEGVRTVSISLSMLSCVLKVCRVSISLSMLSSV